MIFLRDPSNLLEFTSKRLLFCQLYVTILYRSSIRYSSVLIIFDLITNYKRADLYWS